MAMRNVSTRLSGLMLVLLLIVPQTLKDTSLTLTALSISCCRVLGYREDDLEALADSVSVVSFINGRTKPVNATSV